MNLNPFNWRQNYAHLQTKFAADPGHRTPLFAKWCQSSMTTPWPTFQAKHSDEAKLERRVPAKPKANHSITLDGSCPSRIPDIPKAKRSSK